MVVQATKAQERVAQERVAQAVVVQEVAAGMVSPTMVYPIFLAKRELLIPSRLKSRNSMEKIMFNGPKPQD